VAYRAVWHDLPLPLALRYCTVLVETSLPGILLVLSVVVNSSPDHYAIPVAWVYFGFIILSTLHLDFWLCAFTGLVAGVEYAWLSLHFVGVSQVQSLDPGLSSPVSPALRVGLLVGYGLVAGLISFQIRRQFAATLRSAYERNKIVGTLGQHVSRSVADELLKQDLELQSERRDVCVLFLDIQSFTAFAENRCPEEVVAYLNTLFTETVAVISRQGGIVNKFLGDGFMAVFGAPVADRDACQNAITAALEIVERVEALMATGQLVTTRLGIGLHAGEVVAGNVGSEARKEYTIIGDVVNVAARVEQMNRAFGTQLLATQSVVERLARGAWRARPIGSVPVKGRTQPVDVYEVGRSATVRSPI
jgi:adenylate cyclase